MSKPILRTSAIVFSVLIIVALLTSTGGSCQRTNLPEGKADDRAVSKQEPSIADKYSVVLDAQKLLLFPKEDMVFSTHDVVFHIAAGSMVVVHRSDTELGTYVLHESYDGAVRVVCGPQQFFMHPGRELVLSKIKDCEFEAINPWPQIASNNTKRFQLEMGLIAFQSSFSMSSAIAEVEKITGDALKTLQ